MAEPGRAPAGNLPANELFATETLRRRRGDGRRGGRRRGGRGKRRRDRRNRRGRGRGNTGGFSVNSRWKRSSLSEKEGPYNFNEHGVFEGLQPLPFDLNQVMEIISIAGGSEQANTDGGASNSSDVNLSESNMTSDNHTRSLENATLVEVIQVRSLNSDRDVSGLRSDNKKERKANRGSSRGGKRGHGIPSDSIGTVASHISNTQNLSHVSTEDFRKRRLGRRKSESTKTDNMGDRSRRKGRGGRREGDAAGGRRRTGRKGSTTLTHQDGNFSDPLETTGTTADNERKRSGRRGRQKRALSKDGFPTFVGSFTVPKGKLYRWTRNLAGMKSVNEFAFSSTERNVAVVMSFDPNLASLGFINVATLYDFTGRHGSSSVSTNTEIYLDGSANPISAEEQEALLQRTPSLRRQCRGRSIVRATPYGMHPLIHSGPTRDLKLLTLDNQVTLTMRTQPAEDASKVSGSSLPGQSWFRRWGRLRSALGRGSGRLAQWIGQGRWRGGQARGQMRGQGRSQFRSSSGRPQGVFVKGPGNQTFVTPVPSSGQGLWAASQ
ncbi:hypothetical protein ElyMa_001547700 [Elysia marginata]|uniref:Uncharacterized protein n=1 Tax=Elysia marginata TaxID=1093978 RepID=A0AAV4JCL9_9GAST|nr:hypothetical protein ElyMa_001547700 [Elysia marginata]